MDNVLSRAINTGDVSELPDVADFISVYGQDEGIRMHAEVEKHGLATKQKYSAERLTARK